jgi:hypothetical protein
MIIELYKDIDEVKRDFDKLFPNVVVYYLEGEGIYTLTVFSNDDDMVKRINGEVFRFKGNIMDLNSIGMPFDMDGTMFNNIIFGKTNIPYNE